MTEYNVPNSYLCEIIWDDSNVNSKKNRLDIILEYIRANEVFSEVEMKQIKCKLQNTFLKRFCKYWQHLSRQKDS